MQPLVNLRRKIQTPEGERIMAYTVLRTEAGVMPEGRIQMLTTHTPDLFWTPGVSEHENRADALTDLLVCVEDPAETAERFGRFTGRPVLEDGPFSTIALDRGQIVFASCTQIAAFLDGFSPPALPYIAGQALRSSALGVTDTVVRAAGVRPAFASRQLLCMGPDDALGAFLLFHDADVAHPWRKLAQRA